MADESLLRIVVSTDNHLGVWEKEEDRKHDSFRAFEEILQLAQQHDVDMLLLGGDLFHDNKPSRTTINRTIELMNKYCLGDRPVQIQVLNSNQADIFVNGCVNFANPNLNVGLPVFTIHGNHDDPSGADNLSAVDLLSTCGLVNYFGKVLLGGNNIGTIKLQPVLIQKGSTKLALYGLGNVRDERLGRLFQTPGCVQWLRPASNPEISQDDWLNVFVLHQNRVQHGPNAKNCLQERHLPDFLDLVVWGHEHECVPGLTDLQKPSVGDKVVQVLQPGSSVATALSEGEAKPKHAFLLECLVDKWRTIQLPLGSVRPFMWDSLSLAAVAPPLDPEDMGALSAVLERKVNTMIQQANRAAGAANPAAAAAATAGPSSHNGSTQQQQQSAVLPLIRLRVDYTGFGTVNSQRFGQKYVGKVANPHDMLLWTKAAARRVKDEGRGGDESELAAAGLGLSSLRPEQLDQARIEDLVAANLQARLDILHPEDLAQALHQFVEKEEKAALAECVSRVLQQTQVQVLSRPGASAVTGAAAEGEDVDGVVGPPAKEEDIADVINLCVQQRAASRVDASQQQTAGPDPVSAAAAATGAAAGAQLPGRQPDPDLMDVDEDSDENRDPAAAAGGGARARGAKAKAGGMPPPAPKGRQRKGKGAGAAAAAGGASAGGGGFRQAGLMEAFSRGASQGGAGLPTSPQGKTGSNLNGYLTTGGAGAAAGSGGQTPSQATSRSRSAAGSAARGWGSRGGRGARARRGGRKASSAASEELLSSDGDVHSSGEGGQEGISDSEEDEGPPAKKARGATSSQPTRSAAKPRVNYADVAGEEGEGEDDDGGGLISSDDDTQQQQRQTQTQTQRRKPRAAQQQGRSRGVGAAAAAAAAGSDDDDSLSLSEPIEEDSDDEEEKAATKSRKRGRSSSQPKTAGRQAAGRSAQQTQSHTQGLAGGLSSLGPNSIDGGYIDSDSDGDDGAPPPASAAAPLSSAVGGGRRRMLPGSLRSS